MSQRLLAAFTSRFHGLLDASLNVSDKVDSSALKQKLLLCGALWRDLKTSECIQLVFQNIDRSVSF